MPNTVNFPGGATGTNTAFFNDIGHFVASDAGGFPTSTTLVRRNLDNNYVVKIISVSPHNASGNYTAYVYRADGLASGITQRLYGNGSTILLSSLSSDYWQSRVYNNAGTQVNFGRAASGGGTYEYSETEVLVDSWNSYMTGTWTWYTVPTQPTTSTAVSIGTTATVTRGESISDSSYPITSYRVQRAESSNGTTWGAWATAITMTGTTYTYTGLTPGKYYKFRVYAVNAAGNSLARETNTVLVAAVTRYNGSAFIVPTNLKRYNGTSWVNVTSVKRWDGTSWQTIDLTGINP